MPSRAIPPAPPCPPGHTRPCSWHILVVLGQQGILALCTPICHLPSSGPRPYRTRECPTHSLSPSCSPNESLNHGFPHSSRPMSLPLPLSPTGLWLHPSLPGSCPIH